MPQLDDLVLELVVTVLPVGDTAVASDAIVNGIERFLIEQIRVNSTYNIFGNKITQAELIAAFLVLAGLIFIVKQNNKQHEVITKSKNNS